MPKKINFLASVFIVAMGLILSSCTKDSSVLSDTDNSSTGNTPSITTSYITYLIRKGQHYCDQSTLKSVRVSEMKFIARFDSSAIYQTVIANNQLDINKLYGFSEGFNNQYNSARFGWRWSNGALRLFGYVYKTGTRYSQEICTVPLNTDINCSIRLNGYNYIFTVNNNATVTMPRALNSTSASGYQQYPYFGGDEVAPKDIFIKILPQ